jgi:uncharacterized membrane protein
VRTAPLAVHATSKFRMHWHVVFTHFPISFFMVSAGFMVAHLFTHTSCFETASYVTLVAGAAVMWPTTLTGWFTWRSKYKGARTRIFRNKIWISAGMVALSTILAIWHGLFPAEAHTIWHYLYFTGFVLLFFGAVAEGYFGGRLNHR